jgi:MFS family permease
VAMGIIAPISGTLSDRIGSRIITAAGLAIMLVGFAVLTRLNVETTALIFALLYLPLGIGMGVFQSPNNSAIMGAAPPGKLGVVSGMLALNRTLGQTTGIALIGAIWAALTVYHAGPAVTTATGAAPEAQVAALQSTFFVSAAIMAVALALAVWRLLKGKEVGETVTSKQVT